MDFLTSWGQEKCYRNFRKVNFLGEFSIQNPEIARVGANFVASYLGRRRRYFDSVKRFKFLTFQIS